MTTTIARDLILHRSNVDPFGRGVDRTPTEEEIGLARAVDEEAYEYWEQPDFHRQVAADLSETLDYQFTFNNVFGTYIRVRTVDEFDRVILRERRGLKAFYTARGGYIEESHIRTEQWELPRDQIGFHVREEEDKLRSGFAAAISDIASLGSMRLEAEVNRRLLTLAQTAVPVGSDSYVAVATIDEAVVNTAIREVRDAIKPNGQGPVPVTLLGRAAPIDEVSGFTGYADEAKEEIRRTGRLGVYRGANVQVVINYTDEEGESYVAGNELWVLGGTAGQFAMYGGMKTKTWDENTVDYRHYRARKDIGGLLHHPEQVRRIVAADLAP